MIDIKSANFIYSATIKITELGSSRARVAFPEVTDMSVNSRPFGSYVECVNSAKGLMEDFVKDVNNQSKKEKFTVSAEVNPVHSGIETRSRDWGVDELARLWIFDEKEVGKNSIHAVGQARIFALEPVESAARLN